MQDESQPRQEDRESARDERASMRPSTFSLSLAKWGDRLQSLIGVDAPSSLLARRIDAIVADTRRQGITRAAMLTMLDETLFRVPQMSASDAEARAIRLRALTRVALDAYETRLGQADASASVRAFRLGTIARENPNFAPESNDAR